MENIFMFISIFVMFLAFIAEIILVLILIDLFIENKKEKKWKF